MADHVSHPTVESLRILTAEEQSELRRHPFRILANTPAVVADDVPRESAMIEPWGNLIDQIRSAADRLREDEARIQQREDLLKALAIRTREEMQFASERVDRAEAHARDIEVQAKLEIAVWQTRTIAAEDKVRELEAWLTEVRETLVAEFGQFA